MTVFAIAFGIVCGIAAIVFGAMFALLLPLSEPSEAAGVAAVFAGLPILALPRIAEFYEQAITRRNLAAGKPTAIYDYREFQVPWPWMAACGTVVLVALDLISSFVIASVALEWDAPEVLEGDFVKKMFVLALAINFPVMMLGAYLVGRWIGTRCSPRGIIAVLLTFVLLTAVDSGLLQLTPAEYYDSAFLFLNFLEFPFILFCGLVGYWRGRKARWSKYMHYLLAVLPLETRDSIVGLAVAEARSAAAAMLPAGGPQSA